jgi:polyisoprenoid-binding protein YceI
MMKKFQIYITLIVVAISQLTVSAQGNYITRNGMIQFYSHTPVEDIKAVNNEVGSIINAETGEFVITLKMTDFNFKKKLMQQHFNENYVESHKFPKATFRGFITDNENVDYSRSGEYDASVSGDLTIHGVTQTVATTGTILVKNNGIEARAKFELEPEDYDIKIPKIVRNKIAKIMEITVDMAFEPMD